MVKQTLCQLPFREFVCKFNQKIQKCYSSIQVQQNLSKCLLCQSFIKVSVIKDAVIETYLSCLEERLLDIEIPSKRFDNLTKDERNAMYILVFNCRVS